MSFFWTVLAVLSPTFVQESPVSPIPEPLASGEELRLIRELKQTLRVLKRENALLIEGSSQNAQCPAAGVSVRALRHGR